MIMSNEDSETLKKQMTENEKKQEKIIGRITKVSDRGYGFIISDEMKFIKFFFHWTGLVQNTKKFTKLKAGMIVKFIPINLDEVEVEGQEKRGPRAIKIEVI